MRHISYSSLARRRFRFNLNATYIFFLIIVAFCKAGIASPLDDKINKLSDSVRFAPDKALPELLLIQNEALNETKKTRMLFLSTLAVVRTGLFQFDEAMIIAKKMLEVATLADDEDLMIQAWLTEASILMAMNKHQLADRLVSKAAKNAERSQNLQVRIDSLIALGSTSFRNGDFKRALSNFLHGLELSRTSGRLPNVVISLHAIGHFYEKNRDYLLGFAAVDEEISVARSLKYPGWLALAKTNEFSLARSVHDYKRAYNALIEALTISRQLGAKTLITDSLINLSDIMITQGDYRRAEQYAQEAVQKAAEDGNSASEAVARANLGLAYLGLGDLRKGKKESELGLNVWAADGNLVAQQGALLEYGIALEKAGDVVGALAIYHRERKLANELFERRKVAAIIEVQGQYEDRQKQQQIALLRQQNIVKDSKLNAEKLRYQRLWLLLVAAVLVMVILVLAHGKLRFAYLKLTARNKELKQRGACDPLTGLYNRRHFQEFGQVYNKKIPIESGALFLVDIDHFKNINDKHGHAAGDAVLKSTAATLRDAFRETDMIVRWGGEEFLAFVPVLSNSSAESIAKRVLEGVASQLVQINGISISVHASLGFIVFPLAFNGEKLDWKHAIHLADMALYIAKSDGRNCAFGIRGFSSDVQCTLESIEQDLEQAWRAGHVDLVKVLPAL